MMQHLQFSGPPGLTVAGVAGNAVHAGAVLAPAVFALVHVGSAGVALEAGRAAAGELGRRILAFAAVLALGLYK